MRAACDDAAYLQHMLDFEAALAGAEAAAGLIPDSAVAPIAAACKAQAFDQAALAEAAIRAGNLAIPLVKTLTAEVEGQRRSRALRALGRHQPGRDRYRHHAHPARRH